MTQADERTVEELRDELRSRDLKVSGTKEELLERLAADSDDTDGPEAAGNGSPPALRDVVRTIGDNLSAVLGLGAERVSGLTRGDEGWQALVDVVEVSRIPPSTDVLATYAVTADPAGNVAEFKRVRRFRRCDGEDER